jgi:hypothetical protein
MRSFLTILIFWLFISSSHKSLSSVNVYIKDGEKFLTDSSDTTIIYRDIEQIDVYPQNKSKSEARQYSRIEKKIRKVYPFAREAALELQLYNEKFKEIDDPRLKRQYINKVEKELFAKHAEDMKHLTISEGRYLMLLIDRETGETSFELVKELKGSLSAGFWQGLAKLFKNDLKEQYDPVNEHLMVEQIVLMIEKEKP